MSSPSHRSTQQGGAARVTFGNQNQNDGTTTLGGASPRQKKSQPNTAGMPFIGGGYEDLPRLIDLDGESATRYL